MKKKIFFTAVFASLGVATSTSVQAAAVNSGDILHITSPTRGAYGYIVSGSYFSMDASSDYIIQGFEKVGLREGTAGLVIGTTTLPGVFHNGNPVTGETGPIVQSWGYFNSTGTNFLTVPVTGSTTAGLNMSGWRVAWNGVSEINMGGGAWQPANCVAQACVGYTFTNGTARFQWDGIYGSTYTLDYTTTVPYDGLTNFGGVPYYLHLEGTVEAAPVPIPAAAWLFSSGLLGLIGLPARRKKKI